MAELLEDPARLDGVLWARFAVAVPVKLERISKIAFVDLGNEEAVLLLKVLHNAPSQRQDCIPVIFGRVALAELSLGVKVVRQRIASDRAVSHVSGERHIEALVEEGKHFWVRVRIGELEGLRWSEQREEPFIEEELDLGSRGRDAGVLSEGHGAPGLPSLGPLTLKDVEATRLEDSLSNGVVDVAIGAEPQRVLKRR